MPNGLIKYFYYKQWGYKKNKATYLTGKVKDKNLTSNIAWSKLEVRIKPWNQKWKLVMFEADKKKTVTATAKETEMQTKKDY